MKIVSDLKQKMKCCGNCKHYETGHTCDCGNCGEYTCDDWEIAE